MFHKIKNVLAKDNLILIVEFENGIKKEYDVRKLPSKWEIFKELENNSLFNKVKVDIGGYGISWNEFIDLSCEEIWENGTIIEE